MDDAPAEKGPISVESAAEYSVRRTRPDTLLRHDISDEELGVLVDMKRDYLWEGKWVALGLAVGSLPQAISGIKTAYFHKCPISPDAPEMIKNCPIELPVMDLTHIVIFFVATVSFFILQYTMKGKEGAARDLAKAIRERTEQEVKIG